MRIKKIWAFLCIIFLIGSELCYAQSDATFVVDYSDYTVHVSGKTDLAAQPVVLSVLNPGFTQETAFSAPNGFQHHIEIVSDAQSAFTYQFKLHQPDVNTGKFPYFVKSGDETKEDSFIVYSIDEIAALISRILTNGCAALYDSDAFRDIFHLGQYPPYEAAEKNAVCTLIDETLKDYDASGTTLQQRADLEAVIKACCMLTAYNRSELSSILADGVLLYADSYGMDTLDTEYGVNAYHLFINRMSDAGMQKVIVKLMGQGYTDIAQLKQDFIQYTVLYVLTNASAPGYAHVSEALSDGNAQAIGIQLPSRLTTDMQTAIVNHVGDFATVGELNDFLKKLSNGGSGGGSGSASGGGSGGGSGSSREPSISGGSSAGMNMSDDPAQAGAEHKPVPVFGDVADYPWAADAISYLAAEGILNGKSEGVFAPEDCLLREELAKIITEAFGLEYKFLSVTFLDADMGAWYAPYLAAAYENGIVKGLDETHFGVGQAVTRQDFCVMLYRVLEKSSADGYLMLPDTGDSVSFSDGEEIAEYAKDAVLYLTNAGVISGFPDGSFAPAQPCTRVQAAKMVYNGLEQMGQVKNK